ncbi:MAG: coenzyme F420-0:L-glutamate ligase [bacterium]|nr:coenzyme F420-0:L-glutamate ligase [bacterium]
MTISIHPVKGLPEISEGDDLALLIGDLLAESGLGLQPGDVVVVTHKVVSKAEGRMVELEDDGPHSHRHLVESESAAVLRRRGDLVITETRHGFICANAGVDRSNVGPGRAVLLPVDPDRSARRIRSRLIQRFGVEVAVVITDTFGRPFRRGLTDVAIGVAGFKPIRDLRGTPDDHDRVLEVTEVAVADEIAAAADLAKGKVGGIPVAIVRGLSLPAEDGSAIELIRPAPEDLFR